MQPIIKKSSRQLYQYDPNFDYLTSANYGDGLPNATPTWSYDAAGNRNDSICDNLNRPTSIGGVTTTSDILGNRLTTGTTSMTWDCLNRMTSLTNSNGTEAYDYRADGMRVSKSNGTNSTIYRYDGQMGIEDVDTGANPAVTDYALGARGIDAISKTVNGTTTVVYPLYDAHGNMVGDVSKYGSSFQVNDKRSFDAWGNIRQGAQTGDPKGRYCANLGHKQDDESGLIYMRARYYEPTSGRFLSEDPQMQGINYYIYCGSDPVNHRDNSGKDESDLFAGLGLSMVAVIAMIASFACAVAAKTPADLATACRLGWEGLIAEIFASCSMSLSGKTGQYLGGGSLGLLGAFVTNPGQIMGQALAACEGETLTEAAMSKAMGEGGEAVLESAMYCQALIFLIAATDGN